ncbi:hypothetical protein A374_10368 [Fictibacillus macauensis ZFHKF-1]|uniref:DUF309 domain-containing protein n=1 Tax=Fictibacillus macauensis ZFHKF-1 TaxID=1196324 RepID=I8UFP1_9BACL|nr:DUF309 domain-containing protein [Fictibacillus macauensis]EIT85633.1 hypothetical protein A374_10368 [Fictibacillus macauensis ZFHKF-1]
MDLKQYPMEYYTFFITFNEGDYYTCHDLLEDLWMVEKDNYFLKGLLQMTVAIYHYEYGNVKGARAMMQAGYEYIQPYRPLYWGLDLDHVHTFMEQCIARIPADIDKVPFEQVHTLPSFPDLVLVLQEERQ